MRADLARAQEEHETTVAAMRSEMEKGKEQELDREKDLILEEVLEMEKEDKLLEIPNFQMLKTG